MTTVWDESQPLYRQREQHGRQDNWMSRQRYQWSGQWIEKSKDHWMNIISIDYSFRQYNRGNNCYWFCLYNKVTSGDMSIFCEMQSVNSSNSQLNLRNIIVCFNERWLCFSRLFSALFSSAIAGEIFCYLVSRATDDSWFQIFLIMIT
jgi:hypothetical protein